MDIALTLNLVSTLSLLGALVFAGWQLHFAHRQRSRESALQLMHSLRSLEFVEGVIQIAELPDGLSRAEITKRLGGEPGKAWLACMCLDGLGVMVYRGEVELEIAQDFFKNSIAIVWQKLETAIAELRKEQHSETIYEWLQWLAQKQVSSRAVARAPVYR
jgi:hypothetical protein